MTTLLSLVFAASLEFDPLTALADRVIGGGDPGAEVLLRARGPAGLERLLQRRNGASADAAIDRVAGQRYAHVSRLYWYTDLDAARAEAARTKRPILSLRMLGRLTDELSCANSRFFRTVLYADPQVASVMRDRFVLHWSSEREVPVITIDFGDGRILRRTVTGNSAHYVLDADGAVIDAIPGLYSPAAFIAALQRAAAQPIGFAHAIRAGELEQEWSDRLLRTGSVPPALARKKVPASGAIRIAVTKAAVEAPMVIPAAELKKAMNDEAWRRLLVFAAPVLLSRQSLALMRAENFGLDGPAFDRMVARLKKDIAQDTMQNEYLLHREIHLRLATSPRPQFESLNRWIYDELFATPANDPWLGLHDDAIYTGLQNAGLQFRE